MLMGRRKQICLFPAILLAGVSALPGSAYAQAASSAPRPEACAALDRVTLASTEILSATLHPAGEPVPGAKAPSMTGTPGAGPTISGLPAFCRVTGAFHPTPDSDIRFEVWLPAQGWDGRFNGANSGGLAGYINYLDLSAALKAGQATAGSDVGHAMLPGDATWAKGHPEKVRDYGWRGVHLTTVAAKQLIKAYYGRGPDFSYFIGCSNGGRQGLIEASRFPEDYDGIVAGAPAMSLTDTVLSMVNAVQAQLPTGAAIRPEQAGFLQAEVLKQCDAGDGQVDGLIADPRLCRFDARKLACTANASAQCFTSPQISALQRIHAGARDKTGMRQGWGYLPSGGEVGKPVKQFGWEGNILVSFKSPLGPQTLSEGILTQLAPTPIATDTTFDFNRDPARLVAALGADLDAKPDLTRYFARGGKLIIWHGWSDPLLPAESSIAYYQKALRQSGPKAASQMRLFMVPGVQHCAGGPGPDALGQIGAPMPTDTPERSVGAAIQQWVEKGHAPEAITGRRDMIMSMMKPGGAERQRLICAFPKTAVLTSGQDPDKAASYTCARPKK